MPHYVWSAKDLSGNTVIKEVDASSSGEAKSQLEADGYSELVLKEDEIIAAVIAGFDKSAKIFGEEIRVTAAERAKHVNNPSVTYWDALRKGISQTKVAWVVVLIYLGYQLYRGSYSSAAWTFVAVLAWLAFIVCLSLPGVYYHMLIAAVDWDRWDEVLSLVQTLRAIGRIGFIKVPATELTRNHAKALVGLGRLNEGLAEFSQCRGRQDCPSWLYTLFVAGLYDTAKLHDKAIEYNLQAIGENPNPTAYLDLANRYARYMKDQSRARAAMAEAEKSPMVEAAKPFRVRCYGIIEYLEGDYVAAKRDLEAAIDQVEKARGRPFRDGHLSVARAYLCCVLAKLGEMEAAKRNLEQAEQYLVATNESELLAECHRLTGA